MARSDSLAAQGAKLTAGGVCASILVVVVTTGILVAAHSTQVGFSVLTGAGIGLGAMALSQGIITATWKLSPPKALVAALLTYAIALILVMCALVMVNDMGTFILRWVGLGVAVAVAGYLAGIAVVYPRLRILIFSSTPRSNHQEITNTTGPSAE